MPTYEEDDWVPISALQHYSYCPRQCALIHAEQVFAENVHTLRGRAAHARVDEPTGNEEGGVRVERALALFSERLGLVGKADVVEFRADGAPYPIEYKHGRKRIAEHDDLQLAAQALCLEEMTDKPVRSGAIYHHTSRRRREVEITDALRRQVADTTTAVRALLQSGVLPPPVNDKRCDQCSLKEICQPEVVAASGNLHRLRVGLFDPDASP
jgi:CRISPR-associated exonuclease Cas4